MRIRGGSGRVVVEVPKRKKDRKPTQPVDSYYRDGFEVAPPRRVSNGTKANTRAVVRELAAQGRARVTQDERRDASQLQELGRLMGGLTADLVDEVINHFVQRPPGQRTAAMVVLGALTGALLVEFWSVLRGDDALERTIASDEFDATEILEQFVTFIEDTEGQPTRRLVGTLYAY